MLNLNVEKKVVLIIPMIVLIVFSVLNLEFVVANTSEIQISKISSTVEGSNISFNIKFADNVSSIMVFEGDIITKGFSASSINLTRASNNSYSVTLNNVTGTGSNKSIVINPGVGYVDGKGMTDTAYSNTFNIEKKEEIKPIEPIQPTKPQEPSHSNNTSGNDSNNNNNNNSNNNNSGNDNATNNDKNNNSNNNNNIASDNKLVNNDKTINNTTTNINSTSNNNNQNTSIENDVNKVEQENIIEEIKEVKRKINPNTGKM